MSETNSKPRRWSGVPAAGVVLIVAGIAVGVFRVLGLFVTSGTSSTFLVPVPVDAFPSTAGPIWIVNWSMAIGAGLVLVGVILVSGWVGYRRAARHR